MSKIHGQSTGIIFGPAAFLALFVLAGCGAMDDAAPKPPGSSGNGADVKALEDPAADGSGDGAEVEDDFGETETNDEGLSEETGDAGGSEGDLGEIEDDGPDAEEIAAQCGGIDLDDPDKEVLNQQMTGLPIVERGTVILIPYEVTVLGNLSIRSTARQSVTTTSFEVSAQPALAQGRAEEEAAKSAGSTTTTFVEPGERATLIDSHESWAGILCVVQPAVRIQNQVGGMSVDTVFDPPIPSSISPKADPERYEAEVAQEVTWSNLKATVQSSTNDLVPAGTVLTGSVTVRPIDPTLSHTLDGGEEITLTADRAFEVVTDFGSPEATVALGLRPVTRYYIDHEGRQFKSVKSQSGGDTPDAVFVGN